MDTISPVIIVGVIDKDKLLITKYAHADLKGSNHIQLDYEELSTGKWFYRHELPRELNDTSITYEMIEAFRNNKAY